MEMIRVAALTSGRSLPSSRFRVRQHIAALREHGLLAREFTPRISKYARIPGWPPSVRQGYAGPLLLPWLAAKLVSRVPGVVGSRRSDCTWLERELLPGLRTLEPLLARPMVFDVDDAVWLSRPAAEKAIGAIARRAAIIVAGNDFIADWMSQHCERVRVIPTAVDTDRFRPRIAKDDGPFTVGWTGVGDNYPYLAAIQAPLARFFATHPRARLLVIADRPPRLMAREPKRTDVRAGD